MAVRGWMPLPVYVKIAKQQLRHQTKTPPTTGCYFPRKESLGLYRVID